MATATKHRKAERIVARIGRDEKAMIERAALLSGQTTAVFVVASACQAALETLETAERIRLNAEQSRRFVAALLAPARPVPPALAKAADRYRKMVESDLD